MNEQARKEVIATIKAGAEAIRAELLATSGFVVVWHGSALKLQDGKVQLQGDTIYSGSAGEMIRAAAEWNRIIGQDEPRAVAVPAKKAAEMLAKAHAEIMESIEKAGK